MSSALYHNKAERLKNAASQQIQAYTDHAVDTICPNIDKDKSDNVKADIQAIFQLWQDKTIPQIHNADNGNTLLIMPYSEIQFTKARKKKKNAVYKASRARVFLASAEGELSIFRAGSGNKGEKSLEDTLNYYKKLADGDTEFTGVPKHGRLIHNYDRKEFEKIFTCPVARYQGKTSPAAFLQSTLRNVARKYNSDVTLERGTIDELIQSVEKKWLRSAEFSLLAISQRDAMRAILLNKSPNYQDYQWLTKQVSADAQDKRLGAFISYPGLMPLFTRINRGETYSRGHERDVEATARRKLQEMLTSHIDKGLSVPASLKNTFSKKAGMQQIPTKYLGPYHGANDTVFDTHAIKILTQNINDIAHFKREDYPKTTREWSQFQHYCDDFNRAERLTGLSFKSLVDHYGAASVISEKWSDIGDFVEKMRKTILLPLIMQTEKSFKENNMPGCEYILAKDTAYDAEIKQKFLELFTIPQLIRGSTEWHERIETVSSQLKSIAVASGLSWPELIPETTAPNSVKFTALTTKSELEDEGDTMHHCVGGYASNCISNGSHILHLSLSDKNGETFRSTLQLKENKEAGETKITVYQNKAEYNKTPEKRLLAATDWLVKNINEGTIKIDWNKITLERNKVAREYEKNKLINEIGFDPDNLEHCKTAYETMKRFLPKRAQNWSYEEFIESSDLQNAIQNNFNEQITSKSDTRSLSSAEQFIAGMAPR